MYYGLVGHSALLTLSFHELKYYIYNSLFVHPAFSEIRKLANPGKGLGNNSELSI
jgi:hypothetical protein